MTNPDRWLIDHVYEPLSWRSEYYLRLNCFQLAIISESIFTVAALTSLAQRGIDIVALAPIFGGGWMSFALLAIYLDKLMKRTPQFLNPVKPAWGIRMLGLSTYVVVLAIHWRFLRMDVLSLDLMGVGGYMSYLYFMACNPMPPKWEPTRSHHRALKLEPR